jgi:hypothetical protein
LIVTASLSQLVNFDYWQVEATERMLAVARLPPEARV